MNKRAKVTGPVVMPEAQMPMMVGEVAKEDPTWKEGRQLRDEAERALKRLLIHEATVGHSWNIGDVARAIDALRGHR
jgi:hypothetical protein